MTTGRGRAGHAWRKMQARVFATETHCSICGKYVDQTLTFPHPMSRSIDHSVPYSAAPALVLNRSNVHLAHLRCNQAKGNGPAPIKRTPTSRRW